MVILMYMYKSLISYSDSIMIKATPKEVYEALADITNMGNFSPVCKECYFETDNPKFPEFWALGFLSVGFLNVLVSLFAV